MGVNKKPLKLVAFGAFNAFRYLNGATRLGDTNRRFPWIFCRLHEYLLSFGEGWRYNKNQ